MHKPKKRYNFCYIKKQNFKKKYINILYIGEMDLQVRFINSTPMQFFHKSLHTP